MGNDVPGPVGTEGARPTNRVKDISSRNPSSLPKFSGKKFFRGNFPHWGGWDVFFLCVVMVMWYGCMEVR